MNYFVYILANSTNTTLYVGVTDDIARRLNEHKSGVLDGFSKTYKTDKLVYCEKYSDITTAIQREKQLKSWSRQKKNNLVESVNPEWEEIPV